jgi:hypothetical protein
MFYFDNYTHECKALHVGELLLLGGKIGGTWMHTFFLTVALIVATPPASWESSYSQGQQQATTQKKPLVVVFGPGPEGWTKVVKAEAPAQEVTKLLAEKYVCVYVDTNSPQGQKLAQDFAVSGGVGLVISNRNGSSQAFWHQGDLSNHHMIHYLAKYADPAVVVSQTETAYTQRTSYYPQGNFAPAAARPANC